MKTCEFDTNKLAGRDGAGATPPVGVVIRGGKKRLRARPTVGGAPAVAAPTLAALGFSAAAGGSRLYSGVSGVPVCASMVAGALAPARAVRRRKKERKFARARVCRARKWMERTCVYVHHVDKDAFLKGNIDPDPDELDMVFDFCPSYAELLEQVRKDLNWMDHSDVVEFDGRHNVGFGMHIRWKTMHVNSEQCWLAYKDTVTESLDKALELFAIKTNVPNLQLDLNRVASPIVEASPPPINEEANIEPLSAQQSCIQHEPLLKANDEHDDDENDGTVLHDNNLGDLDKYNLQETMDHSIPYSRGYASESDDEGPNEEVDEEGFTTKESEAFTKVLKRDHRTPLFEDLSLADEAVVDGDEGILFGVRPSSHRNKHGKKIILPGYGGVSTQQGKSGVGEEKDAASEEQRLMERAAKKLRDEDAAEARKKKEEEYNARMEEELQIDLAHWRYEARMKEKDKKAIEKRKKEWESNFKKVMAEGATKREREHQRFRERVMEEASKMRKKEEEEEEERKKKKGNGPCSTQ
ncbi:hypothetical protein D1007_34857 [Hordeum vulgare]|nr:hypothetical protein D1007_34857 [Hordeum vulgare]